MAFIVTDTNVTIKYIYNIFIRKVKVQLAERKGLEKSAKMIERP